MKRYLFVLIFCLSSIFLLAAQDLCKKPAFNYVSSNPLNVSNVDDNPSSIEFSDDGLIMFMVGSNGDAVYMYNLSIPYDIQTAVPDSYKFDFKLQQPYPRDITFSSDGLKMYIIGYDGSSKAEINQYSLTEAFDIRTAKYDQIAFSVIDQERYPFGLKFSSSGLRMFVVGINNDEVLQYELSEAYNLSSAVFHGITFPVGSQTLTPRGINFAKNGLIMFILDANGRKIHEYNLVDPFDIEGAQYSDISFSIEKESENPHGFTFSNDGLYMYLLGLNIDEVNMYDLAKPFDISTANFNGICGNPCSTETENIKLRSFAMSQNGHKMYVYGRQHKKINQYSLSKPFDVTTAAFDNIALEEEIGSIEFSEDGLSLFLIQENENYNDVLNHYSLSVPYDISTAIFDNVSYPIYQKTSKTNVDVTFSVDGLKMFTLGGNPDMVHQYTLDMPYDIRTANFDYIAKNVGVYDSSPIGIRFSRDGYKMFILGTNNEIRQYGMFDPYGLSHASLEAVFSFAEIEGWAADFTISGDGSKIFVLDGVKPLILEYYFPENNPPVFTSLEKKAYVEGRTELVHDINANNGDCGAPDDEISYSLAGSDAAHFTVNDEGHLFFKSPPEFDKPLDADYNNKYELDVYAYDNFSFANQNVSIIVIQEPSLILGGNKQLGPDIDGEAFQDRSGVISLSNDGKTLAIGAPGNDENGVGTGNVRIFTFNEGHWDQLGGDIYGEFPEEFFGQMLDLSGDGTTIAISSTKHAKNGDNSGYVKIYQFKNGNWEAYGQTLFGKKPFEFFGRSIDLNDEATILAVGVPGRSSNNENYGAVRVFQFRNNEWIQLGGDINGPIENESFGNTVSISQDGIKLAVGARLSSLYKDGGGVARIYHFKNDIWNQLGTDIYGDNEFDFFGDPVQLSDDGRSVAIGMTHAGFSPGNEYVKVYTFDNSDWIQKGQTLHGEQPGDFFGRAISVSGNGSVIAVGAQRNRGNKGVYTGQANVYAFDGAYWWKQGLSFNGENCYDQYGEYVSISSDGRTLAVSATSNAGTGEYPCIVTFEDYGHVRVFDLQNQPPAFTASSSVLSYDENGDDTVFDFNANNGELEVNDLGIFYEVYGHDSIHFKIDSDGNLTFAEIPDFENPIDIDLDNEYCIGIRAIDDASFFSEIDVVVIVKNVNDNIPKMTDQKFVVDERSQSGTFVGLIHGTDLDLDELTFVIKGGNLFNAFTIQQKNRGEAQLLVKNSEALNFQTNPLFRLRLVAYDGYLTSSDAIVEVELNNILSLEDQVQIKIFPNPISDEINLEYPLGFDKVYLLDLSGRIILEEEIAGESHSVNLNSYSNSIFFLKLTGKMGEIVRKVVRIQ